MKETMTRAELNFFTDVPKILRNIAEQLKSIKEELKKNGKTE